MEDSKLHLSSSVNNKINKNDNYSCSKCFKRYKSALSFISHLKSFCESKKEEAFPFKIPDCDKIADNSNHKIDAAINQSQNLVHSKSNSEESSQDFSSDETTCDSESNSSFRKLTANTCSSCGKSFDIEYGLARHIFEGCVKSRYKCPHCTYQEDKLILAFCHVIKKHPKSKVYLINNANGKKITANRKVKICLRSVPKVRLHNLKTPVEMNSSSSAGSKPLSKPPMDRESKNPSENSKFGQKLNTTNTFTCPKQCGRVFKIRSSVEHHLLKFCPQIKRYKCAYCKKTFSFFRESEDHIEQDHPDETVCAINLKKNTKIYKKPDQIYLKRKSERNSAELSEKAAKKRERNETSTLAASSSKKRKIHESERSGNSVNKPGGNESSKCAESSSKKSEGTVSAKPTKNPVENGLTKLPESATKKGESRKELEKKIPCSNGCGKFFLFPHTMKFHVKFCVLPKRFQCPYCPKICKVSGDITSHVYKCHQGMQNYFIDTLAEEKKDSVSSEEKPNRETIENVARFEKRQLYMKCPKCSNVYDNREDLWEHFEACPKKEPQNPSTVENSTNPPNIEFVSVCEPENSSQPPEVVGEPGDFNYCHMLEDRDDAKVVIDITEDTDSEVEMSAKKTKEGLKKEVRKCVPSSNNQSKLNPSSSHSLKLFVCYNCGRSFINQSTLNIHLFCCSQKVIKYKCPYCEFYTQEELNGFQHIEKVHSNEEISLIDLITRKEVYPKMKRMGFNGDIECVEISSESSESSESSDDDGNDENVEPAEAVKVNAAKVGSKMSFQCPYCNFCTKTPEEGYLHMEMTHVNKSNFMILTEPPKDDEIQIIE